MIPARGPQTMHAMLSVLGYLCYAISDVRSMQSTLCYLRHTIYAVLKICMLLCYLRCAPGTCGQCVLFSTPPMLSRAMLSFQGDSIRHQALTPSTTRTTWWLLLWRLLARLWFMIVSTRGLRASALSQDAPQHAL